MHDSKADIDSISVRAQAARSLVCLLVVLVHVINTAVNAGIRIEDDSLYVYFIDLFLPIRMPLFACLSGFVYAYQPMKVSDWRGFAGKKILRLGLPLFLASSVTFASLVVIARLAGAQYGIDAQPDLSSLWRVYIYPLHHLWFLQALLGVIAIVIVLEALRTLEDFRSWLTVFVLSLVAFATSPFAGVAIFSLRDVNFLLPFFLLGLAAYRFRALVLAPKTMHAVGFIFVTTAVLHAIDISVGHMEFDRTALLAAVLGFSTVLCILRWMPTTQPFIWLGSYSFSIYLYHFPIIAFVALASEKLGLRSTPIFVLLSLTLGVLLPIALEAATRKNHTVSLLLLGQYRKPKTLTPDNRHIEFA